MRIPVVQAVPATSRHQLSVSQTQSPGAAQLVNPGETFSGSVHSSNSITFSEGPEVIQDPPGDTGSLT